MINLLLLLLTVKYGECTYCTVQYSVHCLVCWKSECTYCMLYTA